MPSNCHLAIDYLPNKGHWRGLTLQPDTSNKGNERGFVKGRCCLSIKSKELDNQNVIVQPCGLFISKSHNYLATSPHGFVYNDDSIEVALLK